MHFTKRVAAESRSESKSRQALVAPSTAQKPEQYLGNERLQHLLRTRRLEAKLTVSSPDDAYEHEADRVADQVMRMPAAGAGGAAAVLSAPEQCADLRRSAECGAAAAGLSDATEQAIQSLPGRGCSMPDQVRSFMESRFGADFSAVRLHTDAQAQDLARAVNAKAFTIGSNIVFGAGCYSPTTDRGRHLLAHELTHVVQQAGGAMALQRAPDPKQLNERLRQIGNWEAADRIDGDTRGLRDGLRRGDPDALAEFERAKQAIGAGERFTVEEFAERPRAPEQPQQQRISTRGKEPLRNSPELKKLLPADDHRNEFTAWLKENHKKIEEGAEVQLGKQPTEGHDHLSLKPKELKHWVTRWWQERFGAQPPPWKAQEAAQGKPNPRAAMAEHEGTRMPKANAPMAEHRGASMPSPKRPMDAHESTRIPLPASPMDAQQGSPMPAPGKSPMQAHQSGMPKPSSPMSEHTGGMAPHASPMDAHLGVPMEAPNRAGAAKQNAAEFGAVALLAAQLNSVRSHELQKAQEALAALAPQIDAWREQGRGVTVTVVVEAPEQVDIAAIWAGIGDPGQVVYFKKMYISNVARAVGITSSPAAQSQSGMYANEAPADPDAYDPHELSLQDRIKVQMGEKYPIKKLAPRKGFKYVTRGLYLPGLPTATIPGKAVRGVAGYYRPIAVKLHREGSQQSVQLFGMRRSLAVAKTQFGYQVTMVDRNDNVAYGEAGPMSFVGRDDTHFSRTFSKNEGRPDAYTIDSSFAYTPTPDFDVLVEDAEGKSQDWGMNRITHWRAKILWVKL